MAKQETQTSKLPPEAMLRRLKQWWRLDHAHSAQWRKQAKADFEFVAGEQWRQEDVTKLAEDGRVPITFNRTLTIIEAVSGIEINGRHEVSYLPRGTAPGAVQKNELLSSASRWMDDEADAPTHQSRAFQDAIKVGMGWTEASLSYDEEPDGSYVERRIDPLEMWWDCKAREPNLSDARRIWHVRSVDLEDARAMFPDVDDEDMDATWCDARTADDGKSKEEKRDRSDENSTDADGATVTIARVQWIEQEPYYRALVADPASPQGAKLVEMSLDQMKDANASGQVMKAVKAMRKVYKQAFVGQVVLGTEFEAPCPHFSFNAVTGKIHDTKGTFYGLVHLIRDPQMWANKWLSQGLHILNSTAKGGVIAEEDAFADQRDAEENYARPDGIVWAAKGAIRDQKIMAKPGAGMPAGFIQLMEFAISSIRDASGINMELLGLRDANQAGVLEAQRKQAGMTILATMFDSMRAFRKRIGRVRLYYLQTYLADGRMVRLAGPEGEQYVPLIKDKVAGRYDVIVADAPTSPNQREQTWQQMQPLLAMYKDALPPQLMLELLEFSPIPSAVVERVRKAIADAEAQKMNDPKAKAMDELAMRGAVADVAEKEAKAAKTTADAEATKVGTAVKVADAEHQRRNPQPPRSGARQPVS